MDCHIHTNSLMLRQIHTGVERLRCLEVKLPLSLTISKEDCHAVQNSPVGLTSVKSHCMHLYPGWHESIKVPCNSWLHTQLTASQTGVERLEKPRYISHALTHSHTHTPACFESFSSSSSYRKKFICSDMCYSTCSQPGTFCFSRCLQVECGLMHSNHFQLQQVKSSIMSKLVFCPLENRITVLYVRKFPLFSQQLLQ